MHSLQKFIFAAQKNINMNIKEFKHTTLVPIDFSENSMFSLEHAAQIAHITEDKNQKITLLHVLEHQHMDEPFYEGKDISMSTGLSLMIEGAVNRIQKIIDEKLTGKNFKANYLIGSGKVYREIPEIAKMVEASYIVMGSHGGSGIQSFLGSNAARVIQLAACPTIVVRNKHIGSGYKNIVLPLDLTKETKQKVSFAVKIAKYFGSTIHIFTVTEEDEFLAHRINNNMKQVNEYITENGIKTTATYLTDVPGNFADVTLDFAKNNNADLIVIMTQQERSLSEYIFGSYAQQIVNKSPIPVMAINPRADLVGSFEITSGMTR